MRAFGIIFIALLFLAVIRQAIVALVVVLAILLLWCVLARPREVLGMLLIGGAWTFLAHHPVASVVTLAIVAVIGFVGRLAGGGEP